MTQCNHCILVVEDSDEDFDMISRGISQAGINNHIERMENAADARDWLASGKGQACMVMMDLNLPGGEGGHSLLRQFKQHPDHRTTPLIVLSTSGNARDIAQCYESGANSYHTKPLETPRFHGLVQSITEYWFNHAIVLGAIR